jgi:uncharacterized protein YndB with AHSA1/START domain
MNELKHALERSVVICALRSTVFEFFTNSDLFASWFGRGSSIQPRQGGKVVICYPGEVVAGGEVLEMVDGERIVFTYGYESGKPIPLGASRVSIFLADHPEGTEVRLKHDFSDPAMRDAHDSGWRYQMALFANVAADVQHRGYLELLDEYFAAWNTVDTGMRSSILARVVSPAVRFRDAYGCLEGRTELDAHIGAIRQHMPGMNLQREGDAVQCQGTAMARWVAKKEDGSESARGTNLFHFTPEGRIHSITGFWMGKA